MSALNKVDRPEPILHDQQLTIGSGARTTFGTGSIKGLPEAVRSLGGSRVFLVTDNGLVASGLSAMVVRLLNDAGIDVAVFSDLRPNPAAEDIAAGGLALRKFGEGIVVGLGGGTSLDGAKGISLAAANDVPIRDLDYRNEIAHPGQPVIAIPTTAGTGSETNSYGVIEDNATHRKFYIGNASVAPRVVILDPALTTGLPPGATAATGVDALTHALESLMAKHRNPLSHILDLQVVTTVHRWLPVAVANGAEIEARAQMLLAAHLAGLAFANTGLGLAHALAHTLSALVGTPHGVALAVVLPSVIEFNAPARGAELAEVGAALGASKQEAGERGARIVSVSVRGLLSQLGMPTTLGAVGLTPAMVDSLVFGAMADVVLRNNPIQPTQAQLGLLVESLL
jgi:alcohol dehydrogenase class IV